MLAGPTVAPVREEVVVHAHPGRAAEQRAGDHRPDRSRRAGATAAAGRARRVGPHAEPHRGVDVLDRPLRRARGGHRPHPRRPDPAAARGHLRLDEETTCRNLLADHGRRVRPRRPRRHPAGARAAGLRRQRPRLGRRGPRRRPRERPPGPRDALGRHVGGPQHHPPQRRLGAVPGRGAGVRLPLGARPCRADQRRRRRHHDPRRGLAVPHAGTVPRAGRHDVAPRRHRGVRRGQRLAVDQHAACVRRLRGLPADLQGRRDRARWRPSSCCSTGSSRGR